MEPTEEAVVTQLLNLLPTVDTDTATTKDILNLLKEHFGVSVRVHKSRIMAEIVKFVEESKNKHELEGEHVLAVELMPFVYLRVTDFLETRRVDLRHFYESKENKKILRPTAKGVALRMEEFKTLVEHVEELKSAATERRLDFVVELGANNRATITQFKGKVRLDVRSFYTDKSDGVTFKPTRKGVSMDPFTLDVIKEHAASVLEAMDAPPTTTRPKRPLQKEEDDGSPVRKEQKKETDEILYSCELGDKIRLRIQPFRGAIRMDLRNYYKDKATGEERPTQKGVSLTKEQTEILLHSLDGLKQAAEREERDYQVELGSLRRASVFIMRGRVMVDVREYYQPAGGESPRPGRKGVCLDLTQLQMLIDCQNDVSNAMNE